MNGEFKAKLIDQINDAGYILDEVNIIEDRLYKFNKHRNIYSYFCITFEKCECGWVMSSSIIDTSNQDYIMHTPYALTTHELGLFFQLLCILEEEAA